MGWLLGFGLVSTVAVLFYVRRGRSRQGSGWLLAVGGAFVTTAVLFSLASGIFHPYYVSLLAPFLAALIGAGAAVLLAPGRTMRILAPLAVLAGMATVLVVRADYPGQLTWLVPVLIAVCLPAAAVLGLASARRVRLAAVCSSLAVLLMAPTVWAFDTLGHPTSGTFPAGGPASAAAGGPGGFAGRGGGLRPGGFGAGPRLFGAGGTGALAPGAGAAGPPAAGLGPPPGASAGAGQIPGARFPGAGAGGFGGGAGAFGGTASLTPALSYVKSHGGGTIAVASQSGAASAIISQDAEVAGIGGFSGRESSVSVSWLAQEVRAGRIRWLLDEEGGSSLRGRLRGTPGRARRRRSRRPRAPAAGSPSPAAPPAVRAPCMTAAGGRRSWKGR